MSPQKKSVLVKGSAAILAGLLLWTLTRSDWLGVAVLVLAILSLLLFHTKRWPRFVKIASLHSTSLLTVIYLWRLELDSILKLLATLLIIGFALWLTEGEDQKEEQSTFILRHSRAKNLLMFVVMNMFLLTFTAVLMVLIDNRKEMLGILFVLGLLLVVSMLVVFFLGWLIILKRLLLAPIVVRIDETGVHYHYSVFNRKNKVMFIPWNNIHDFAFDDLTVEYRKDYVPVRRKISYLNLFVEAGYLKDYNAWRDNIFLGRKKTGDSLSIVSDSFQPFNSEAIYAFAYEKIVEHLPKDD